MIPDHFDGVEPYAVYFQGGLTFPHAKYGIMRAVQQLKNDGLVSVTDAIQKL